MDGILTYTKDFLFPLFFFFFEDTEKRGNHLIDCHVKLVLDWIGFGEL